jgi:hypothetical protein
LLPSIFPPPPTLPIPSVVSICVLRSFTFISHSAGKWPHSLPDGTLFSQWNARRWDLHRYRWAGGGGGGVLIRGTADEKGGRLSTKLKCR